MTMKTSNKLRELIKENKKFLIVSHINPEGDAIGSCIALALGLKKMRKSVYILSKDPVPDILKFLPHSDLINTKKPSVNFDVLIMVDCNTIERTGLSALGARLPFVGQGTKNIKVKATAVIDHHSTISPDKRHIIWVDVNASAAGELIYKLLKALRIPIDKKIATNLYTAILTDTGGFRYSNTSVESVRIASDLIEAGAEPWKIAKEVYESISLNCLRLLSQMLPTLEKQGKIAWVTVTLLMFKKTSTCAQDTENFVDYPRKVKGIEVAVFFREEVKNRCKVSLRSKGKVNVADIAKTFGGGGHISAAGCVVNGSLAEVKKKVLKTVRKALKT